MIGETNAGSGGVKVNGVLSAYTVASGYSVSAGDFVSVLDADDGTIIPSTVCIVGVSLTGGGGGDSVAVYVPA